MRIPLYNQSLNAVVVDGVQISGFMEGDWMEIKPEGNAADRTKGGDGPSMNVAVAQGGTVTISLMPTSPALGALYALRQLQQAAPTLFSIVIQTGVQELIAAAGCAFGEMPQFTTGGPKMTARKFLFECLQIPMDLSGVASLAAQVAAAI